jgi:hypothetical protein
MRLYEDTVRRFFATSAIYLSLPLTAGDVPVVRDESCEAGSDMAERHARRHRLMINREISIMLNTLLDEERTARGSIRSARLGADEVLMEARQRPETTVETWNSQHSASR